MPEAASCARHARTRLLPVTLSISHSLSHFPGHTRSYTLPTPLDLASLIVKFGTGCYLWKSDLERAYRQLRVDPLDYPLLGIQHKNRTHSDICPSFGCRSSGAAQQRVSNALVYLMGKSDINMLAYMSMTLQVWPALVHRRPHTWQNLRKLANIWDSSWRQTRLPSPPQIWNS